MLYKTVQVRVHPCLILPKSGFPSSKRIAGREAGEKERKRALFFWALPPTAVAATTASAAAAAVAAVAASVAAAEKKWKEKSLAQRRS